MLLLALLTDLRRTRHLINQVLRICDGESVLFSETGSNANQNALPHCDRKVAAVGRCLGGVSDHCQELFFCFFLCDIFTFPMAYIHVKHNSGLRKLR